MGETATRHRHPASGRPGSVRRRHHGPGPLPIVLLSVPAVLLLALAGGAFAGHRTAAGGAAESVAAAPGVVRVGLRSDLEQWRIGCCDTVLRPSAGDPLRLDAAAIGVPALGGATASTCRVQLAAQRDEGQARSLAADLAGELSAALGTEVVGSVVFDAQTGLFRVRVGAFSRRDPAERLRDGLTLRGMQGTWVFSEASAGGVGSFDLEIAGERRQLPGPWLQIDHPSGADVDGVRYRGRLLLFLNERGRINLINELDLEEYLRGVVPRELGPESYPHLEALKAQAIAARTYTLSQLGGFAGEGFDLCATPRCQVYGGRSAEHPLTDRAIAETRGEVLWRSDQLAETLYTATCGGHTEDVDQVFPERHGLHLVGVPCIEGGAHRLAGAAPDGVGLALGLAAALGARSPAVSTAQTLPVLIEDLRALARTVRLPEAPWIDDPARPAAEGATDGIERLGRWIGDQFDLVLERQLLELPAVSLVDALIEETAGLEGAPEAAVAGHGSRLDEVTSARLVVALARRTGALEVLEAQHLALPPGSWRARTATLTPGPAPEAEDGRDSAASERVWRTVELERSDDLLLFAAGEGGATAAVASTRVVPGDRLLLFVRSGRLVAALAPGPWRAEPELEDRGTWSRFRSLEQLRGQVAERIPGFDLATIDVMRRGRSGRVVELRLVDRSGRAVALEGLAIRWTLDLPDTLFSMQRLDDRGGYLFQGRGWGHGVGMCQVGAVGMARYGHDYRQILTHYYEGARVAVLAPSVTGAGGESGQ